MLHIHDIAFIIRVELVEYIKHHRYYLDKEKLVYILAMKIDIITRN